MPWKRDTPGCPCCGQTPCIVTMTCDDDNGTTDCCSSGNEGPCCISVRLEGLSAGGAYCTLLNETKVLRNFDTDQPLQWRAPTYQHTFTAPDSDSEFQLVYVVDISGAGGSAIQTGTVQLHRFGVTIASWTKTLATGTNRTDCSGWNEEEHTIASSTGACVTTGSKAYVTSNIGDCDPSWSCGCLPDGGQGGPDSNPTDVEIEVDIPAGLFNNLLGQCGEVVNNTTVTLTQFTEGFDGNRCSWRLSPTTRIYFRMYLEEISETQCTATFAIYLRNTNPGPGLYSRRHLYTRTYNKTSPMSIAGSPYTFAYASSDGTDPACFIASPNISFTVRVVTP